MVVHDLDGLRAGRGPSKAQAILVVDANAVLTGAAPLECLETIARRDAQVVESTSDHQLSQFAPSSSPEVICACCLPNCELYRTAQHTHAA